MPTELNLDHLPDVAKFLYLYRDTLLKQDLKEQHVERGGTLFCPSAKCGDYRPMLIRTDYTPTKRWLPDLDAAKKKAGDDPKNHQNFLVLDQPLDGQLAPTLLHYECFVCETTFAALIYKGPDGPALAVFPSAYSGRGRKHTPPKIAFYLDQAYRANTVSAHAAALGMYRSALEALLCNQGYDKKGLTCGARLKLLEKAVAANTAPAWASDIGTDTDTMKVLKDLADRVLHPEESRQPQWSKINADLIAKVEKIFDLLLYRVYEKEREDQDLKTAVSAALVTDPPATTPAASP